VSSNRRPIASPTSSSHHAFPRTVAPVAPPRARSGHITDAWDRRTNAAYLAELLRPEVCLERTAPLAPGFFVPDMGALDHAGVAAYISARLPRETPGMFGLHANAEIGYLTATGDELLRSVLAMCPLLAAAPAAAAAAAPTSSGGGGGGAATPPALAASSKDAGVRAILDSLLERLPPPFSLLELEARAAPLLGGPSSPFVLVCLQECESMNALLGEMCRSLGELRKGLDGALNMSEAMEDLAGALAVNQVPGRDPLSKCGSWERLAWPSRRGLASWFGDLLRRCEQLAAWSAAFVTPASVWLPGLFNPMAFITAVVQRAARATGRPLDKMTVTVHVTTLTRPEQAAAAVAAAAAAAASSTAGATTTTSGGGGMFVHGLLMEGAGWPSAPGGGGSSGDDDAPGAVAGPDGVPVAGHVTDARMKQLLQPLPLLYLTAEPVQPGWTPSSVGYLRRDPAVYEAPVYATTSRGPTYVFLATLACAHPVSRWVLAGAALVLQEDD
jgi:dynein heavy chain, axonemal